MFLNGQRGYNRDGEQWSKGSFLLVFSYSHIEFPKEYKESGNALFACVRDLRLSQFGHWMMGRVKLGKITVSVSGAYGHDGLPGDWKPEIAPWLHLVPQDLKEAFWKGGGHNSSGEEGPAMKAWAIKNVNLLRSKKKKVEQVLATP